MAAGSSAPELFVSLADNVLTEPGKAIGIGTIIGSAIFNICVVSPSVHLSNPDVLCSSANRLFLLTFPLPSFTSPP